MGKQFQRCDLQDSFSSTDILPRVVELSRLAGSAILGVVHAGALRARAKADDSPVTDADLASNVVLLEGLARLGPEPIVSEESLELVDAGADWKSGRFWLVDPLDGTRDFVAGKSSYVVNVALIENGRPILGVVHAPALNATYWAAAGAGAFKDGQRIRNDSTRSELRALASGAAPSPRAIEFVRSSPIKSVERMGSAIKFCLVAEGIGDVYPRFGRTYEWDTAAGHAILDEAGCRLLALEDGEPLAYGKPEFLNGGFLAARSDLDLTPIMRAAAAGAKRGK